MTSHEMESERTANADNQSANGEPGARWTGRRRNRCTPDLDRVLGEMAARPHLRGEGGPGRNGGTGPRGAGHRRRELRSPRLVRRLTKGSSLRPDNRFLRRNRYRPRSPICSPALYAPCSLTRNLRVV